MTKDIERIQSEIIEKSFEIAKKIISGKDIELRKSSSGVVIIEIDKKVIFK